jgi:hypothetical protein
MSVRRGAGDPEQSPGGLWSVSCPPDCGDAVRESLDAGAGPGGGAAAAVVAYLEADDVVRCRRRTVALVPWANLARLRLVEHVVMLPSMRVAMLRRRDEYSGRAAWCGGGPVVDLDL